MFKCLVDLTPDATSADFGWGELSGGCQILLHGQNMGRAGNRKKKKKNRLDMKNICPQSDCPSLASVFLPIPARQHNGIAADVANSRPPGCLSFPPCNPFSLQPVLLLYFFFRREAHLLVFCPLPPALSANLTLGRRFFDRPPPPCRPSPSVSALANRTKQQSAKSY